MQNTARDPVPSAVFCIQHLGQGLVLYSAYSTPFRAKTITYRIVIVHYSSIYMSDLYMV